jgi:predicted RNase H-like HicB family nuclease
MTTKGFVQMIKRLRPRRAPTRLRLEIAVILEPDDDGFHAYAPALNGLHVGGSTEAEALKHAEEAIGMHLRSLAAHGDPLPVGPYLRVEEEASPPPEIVAPATKKSVTFEWPSMQMCGTN